MQSENKSKSLAPTPGAVIDKVAGSAGPNSRRSSRYKWLRRLCRRWGGRKCVFGNGDQLSPAMFDRKVGDYLHGLAEFVGSSLRVPKAVPDFGVPQV